MDIFNKAALAKQNKGNLLEYNLYGALQTINVKALFNLYVPYGDNKVSEIDVVGIDVSGLYVFECKNYRGKIYGSENDEYWLSQSRVDRKGGRDKAFEFYNPIKQNEGHIISLSRYIDCPMYNIVVFSDTSILNVQSSGYVIQLRDVVNTFYAIKGKSDYHLDVNCTYNALSKFII